MKIRNMLLIFVLLLVSLMLSAFVPAQTTEPPASDAVPAAVVAFLPILLGWLGVPLVNALKSWLKLSNPIQNLWLTFGASLVLSIVALWMTGLILPMSTPADFQKFFVTVFAVATLIYKSFPGNPAPTPNPEAESKQR